MKSSFMYLVILGTVILFLQTFVSAAPLVSIGSNTDVYFNGSSSLRWTSNVFRDEAEETDDLTWTLSPGFEVNVGRGLTNADLSIITRYDIIRYEDQDQLDTELFHIKAVGSYTSSRLALSGSAYFDESKMNSGENNITNDLIEYDAYGATVDSEYRVSPKFSFGAGARYSEKVYKTFDDAFPDRTIMSAPFDVFYELTPKLDLSLGYTFTNTDIEETIRAIAPTQVRITSDYETDSHFFNIGARGQLLPKLTGSFKVGYRTRSSGDSTIQTIQLSDGTTVGSTSQTNRDDSGLLGLDANFTWTATPKLAVNFDLSRDFGVGGEGQSTEQSSVILGGNYSINSFFTLNANLGYTLADYSNSEREDDQYNAGLRLFYLPNQYWQISTGYTFTENDSNIRSNSYNDHSIDLTATLRY